MRLRDYLASKAVMLCAIGIALILWGVFAYLCGANAVLLWGSEAFFAVAVIVRYAVGYAVVNSRLKRLKKSAAELDKKYLLGELLSKPHDSVEREYYDVMSSVSRSAIGEAENAEREKEEYCEFVEQWIHELKTPLDRLGTSRRDMCRTLFRQIFTFFVLPFALPLLISLPAGIICFSLMTAAGLPIAATQAATAAGIIALVMLAVYALYFAATYLISKRAVLPVK